MQYKAYTKLINKHKAYNFWSPTERLGPRREQAKLCPHRRTMKYKAYIKLYIYL